MIPRLRLDLRDQLHLRHRLVRRALLAPTHSSAALLKRNVITHCHPYYWATTLVPTSCGPSLAGDEHSFADPEAPGCDLDELVITDELDRLLEVERAW